MSLHFFDIVFARGGADHEPPPRFISLLEWEAHARGMVFVHCRRDDQAEAMRVALEHGSLHITCLIDYMGRSFRDDYALSRAVKNTGGFVVSDPDQVRRFGDKAVMHRELLRARVALPRTLLWPPHAPDRDLTDVERRWLGSRIVGKPALGSGCDGVALDLDGTRESLAALRAYDPDDHFLLQEFVTPLSLDGRPAWFRVYNCFGRVFACFWNPHTHETSLVTPEELAYYQLADLERLSRTIASISGYTWFSSEIALMERDGRRVFLPIDYLNNKCYMLTHAEVGAQGLPDFVAESVARELVEQAQCHTHRYAEARVA
jgi:hypothetical protein